MAVDFRKTSGAAGTAGDASSAGGGGCAAFNFAQKNFPPQTVLSFGRICSLIQFTREIDPNYAVIIHSRRCEGFEYMAPYNVTTTKLVRSFGVPNFFNNLYPQEDREWTVISSSLIARVLVLELESARGGDTPVIGRATLKISFEQTHNVALIRFAEKLHPSKASRPQTPVFNPNHLELPGCHHPFAAQANHPIAQMPAGRPIVVCDEGR